MGADRRHYTRACNINQLTNKMDLIELDIKFVMKRRKKIRIRKELKKEIRKNLEELVWDTHENPT